MVYSSQAKQTLKSLLVVLLCSGLSVTAAITDQEYNDQRVSFKVANHSSVAVQVKLFHEGLHYRDLYISPYYASELSAVPEGLYTLEVYDTADNFMGYIEETKKVSAFDNGSTLVSISRFNLKPETKTKLNYSDVTAMSERIDINKLAANLPKPQVAQIAAKAAEIAAEAETLRKVKLANLSNYLLYIELNDAQGKALISPRFIANDAYSPEALKEADSVVLVHNDATIKIKAFKSTEAEARDCLTAETCDKILKTIELKTSELKIDDSDSYIWIIDELP